MIIKSILYLSILLTIVFSVMPGSGESDHHWDKVGHFLAYGFIYFLVLWIYCQKNERNGRQFLSKTNKKPLALLSFIDLVLLGTSLEFIQHHIPSRSMSFYDFVANTLGLLTALAIYQWVSQKNINALR